MGRKSTYSPSITQWLSVNSPLVPHPHNISPFSPNIPQEIVNTSTVYLHLSRSKIWEINGLSTDQHFVNTLLSKSFKEFYSGEYMGETLIHMIKLIISLHHWSRVGAMLGECRKDRTTVGISYCDITLWQISDIVTVENSHNILFSQVKTVTKFDFCHKVISHNIRFLLYHFDQILTSKVVTISDTYCFALPAPRKVAVSDKV